MELVNHVNGVSLKINLYLFKVRLSKTFNIYGEKRRNLLFQFNRFENGYCDIYLRVFKRYSLSISGIKLKQGKRWFVGNREYK